MAESMTNLEKLRLFIENAPPHDGFMSPIIGAIGIDWMICAECIRRIQGRGCRLPEPVTLIWPDDGIKVHCDLKEFHDG